MVGVHLVPLPVVGANGPRDNGVLGKLGRPRGVPAWVVGLGPWLAL
jgi:hypothetical protein